MFPYSGYRDSVSGDEKDSKFAVGFDGRYSVTSNLDLLLGIELGMANMISFSYKGFYPYEGSPFEDKARSFVIKASYLIRI